jgi:hypothetical protein
VADSVAASSPAPANRQCDERLQQAGVRPVVEKKVKGPQPLAGEIVLFTGTLIR